jgi:uncharacterized protein (TIGR03792 family)
MTVEWLRYRVPRESRDVFLKADADSWTAMLSQQAGFIQKQTWANPQTPDELNLVIYWESKAQWKAVPEDALANTHEVFVQKVGQAFTLLGVLEYDVL